MKLIRLAPSAPALKHGTALALGMFDAVHCGHRQILLAAKQQSTARAIACAVLCFSASPHGAPALLPEEERLAQFAALGVDYAAVFDFAELKDLPPQAFFDDIVCDALHARAVFAGYNYRFGAEARGDAALLKSLAAARGVDCFITPPVMPDGAPVSATRIRAALAAGEIEKANRLLAYPYYVRGRVLHGKALGRTLGFPTVNLALPPHGAPLAGGIYYTTVSVDGKTYPAVSNVGVRPTVETGGVCNLETHLLDFSGDLYGREVTVTFYGRGRGEVQFESTDALKAAVEKDIALARAFFRREGKRICENA